MIAFEVVSAVLSVNSSSVSGVSSNVGDDMVNQRGTLSIRSAIVTFRCAERELAIIAQLSE